MNKKKYKKLIEAPVIKVDVKLQLPILPIEIKYKGNIQERYVIKQCSSWN